MKPEGASPETLTKIYKYCAFQDRSREEVRKKLLDLGVFRSALDKWLEHLEDEGFVNEERYLRAYVRGKFFQNQWGRTKVMYTLRQRNGSMEMASRLWEEEVSTEAYHALIRKLYERKTDGAELTAELRDKAYRYLMQKGFEWAEIQAALRASD